MHIIHVVSTRSDVMTLSAVFQAFASRRTQQTLVCTSRDDRTISAAVLRELQLPASFMELHAPRAADPSSAAQALLHMERLARAERPDLVLVYGASDSATVAALGATLAGIDVGHLEAGVRSTSWKRADVNGMIIDRIATWHFTSSSDAGETLAAEGVSPGSIECVGNALIDTAVRLMPRAQPRPLLEMFGLMNGAGVRPYALVALERPENVGDEATLARIMDALSDTAADVPVVFPVYPGTRALMRDHQLRFSGLLVTEPLTCLQSLGFQHHAAVVITDSASVQDESTYLGVPCLTLDDTTDRVVTVRSGTNRVIGREPEYLRMHVSRVLAAGGARGGVPPLWDGRAAERLADYLLAPPRTAPASADASLVLQGPVRMVRASDLRPHLLLGGAPDA